MKKKFRDSNRLESHKFQTTQVYPKISIVTPNLNGGENLNETLQSVLNQNYPNLEYIVIDGGSSDNSIEIIKKYHKYLSYWESSPDKGLYHAVQKGFEKSTGDIMGWINSDDILIKNSLFTIAEIFLNHPNVHWLQGYPTVIDDYSRIVYSRPPVFLKKFFYSKQYRSGSFIQQESTFWTKSLWQRSGSYVSTDYKYAGDFELWIRFFNLEKLYITSAILGAFRKRMEGQLSVNNYTQYLTECDIIIDASMKNISRKEKRELKFISFLYNINKKIPFFSFDSYFNHCFPGTKNQPNYINYNFGSLKF